MIAMPLALLALSWALAVVVGRAKWRNPLSAGLGFCGRWSDHRRVLSIQPIRYLHISSHGSASALGYVIWRYADALTFYRRLGLVVGAVVALTVLSFIMYQPYREWYSQVYSALDPWKGPFTPISSYLTHWFVLLFIVVSWMVWETHEWMADTPVSSLRKLKPYQLLIEGSSS